MKLKNRLVRTAQILKDAREIVATRWNKSYYVSKDGKNKSDLGKWLGIPDDDDDTWDYCGDGALRRSVKNQLKNWNEVKKNSERETLLHDAQKALSGPIAKRLESIGIAPPSDRSHQMMWYFNDLESTTQETMLEVYDEAIKDVCERVIKCADEEDKDAA